MDDLSGLDWSKPTSSQSKPPMPMNPSYPTLQPTPSPVGSGRSTPASTSQVPGSSSSLAKPAVKPAQDSFSNLVNFGPGRAKQNLSLAERQAQLEAERKQKEAEKRKQVEKQFGNAQQWDTLGSRAFTPSPSIPQPAVANGNPTNDDDLFAAFNKDTKVDTSSHYPPPNIHRATPPEEKRHLDLSDASAWDASASAGNRNGTQGGGFDDDDDPFGLNELNQRTTSSAPAQAPFVTDDDFLGDLGRPVEEVRMKQQQQQQQQQPEPGKPIENGEESTSEDERLPPRRNQREDRGETGASKEFDRAVAQLMDYGFTPEDARRGLSQSGAGLNVQAAANWLLDDAHRRAKEKAQGRSSSTSSTRLANQQSDRHTSNSSGRGGDSDLAKSAAAVGNSLFKTANSLWKTGQKKMQQAVADFQQDGGDPNQPKWMRDAQQGRGHDTGRAHDDATDEAKALEAGLQRKSNQRSSRPTEDPRQGLHQSRTASPAASSSGTQSRNSPVPRWQQTSSPAVPDARTRLTRLNADDDDTFFVSANRRKKMTATPPAQRQQDPEPDLLFNTEPSKPSPSLSHRPSQPSPQRPAQRQSPSLLKQQQATPPTSRRATPRPARQIPPISPTDLAKSTKYRLEGSAHFKRGDFVMAYSSYSNSISALPATHPLMIVLLSNRALTATKTGDVKQTVSDADEALKLIGPGKGVGETIDVQGEDGKGEQKSMKDLYGKALTRKAQALEQLEKWADALAVWEQCVEDGIGGATATNGRQRCKKITAPKPKTPPAPKPTAKAKPKPSAAASLAPQKSSDAVNKLRAADAASAKEDDEKFALADSVDARVGAWRDGKRDNLRALLSTLDQVLWANSGWTKIGLHQLIAANKVKMSYMKAAATTHPDKLPNDASTEIRMIAAIVFATLNESWDKFRTENGV